MKKIIKTIFDYIAEFRRIPRRVKSKNAEEWRTCKMCKSGFTLLPDVDGYRYVTNIDWSIKPYAGKQEFTFDKEIDLGEQQKFIDDNLKIYGWSVEIKWVNNQNSSWTNHWNHRIYNSRSVALEAIIQFKKSGIYNNIDFRILPLYVVDNSYIREISINKILKK